MKTLRLTVISALALLILAGCESMPENRQGDGREAADRAKANAEKAYDDMKEDMN